MTEDAQEQAAAEQEALVDALGMTPAEADELARSDRNQLIGGIEQILSEGASLDPMVLAHVEATRRARRRGRRSLAMAYGALPPPANGNGSNDA
jgi:hypothetical protein